MSHTTIGLVLIAVTLTYAVAAGVSIVLGERTLREIRRRYPDHWAESGNPTYLSLAIMGRKFWRPVSASNYFTFRRYNELADAELQRKSETVRRWQRVQTVGIVALLIIIGYTTYGAR